MTQENEKQALLPCPFCGGEAGMIEGEKFEHIRAGLLKFYFALCNCGARSEGSFKREYAVDHWNTRTQPQANAVSGDAGIAARKYQGRNAP